MTDREEAALDVVVLCGGLGRRLRSAIGESQKTLVEINGRVFLDIVLDWLAAQGVRRVIGAVGYKAEAVQAHYQSCPREDIHLTFSMEASPLGTGGAVRQAVSQVRTDPFGVVNGDSLCPLDLSAMRRFHDRRSSILTLAGRAQADRDRPLDYGVMAADPNGRLTTFYEKDRPLSSSERAFVNAGIYLFTQQAVDLFPGEKVFSLEKDFFPRLTRKEAFVFPSEAPLLDIGTPQRLAEARRVLRSQEKRL